MKESKIQTFNYLIPQDIQLESVVLGAILIESEILSVIISQLPHEEIFYLKEHQEVFLAIRSLFDTGKQVDVMTVFNECRKQKFKTTASFINDLTAKVNSSANTEYHIFVLKELWIRRVLIIQAQFIQNKSYDLSEDVFATLSKSQHVILRTTDFLSAKKGNTIQEVAHIILDANFGKNGFVQSGLMNCDKILGSGFWNGTLTIIASRPGMGKTSVALTLARNAALMFAKKVAFFSLEMQNTSLGLKILSRETRIPVNRIKKKIFYDNEHDVIQKAMLNIYNMSLFLDDEANLTIAKLRAKAISLKSKYGIEIIFVDYLQLMKGEGSNREQEIASISRGLKLLAKELDIPVIALSQLSREVDKRSDKRPVLSDLRESGAIEQDADNVIFLYRPEYYNISEDESYSETNFKTKNILEMVYAKNREGYLGKDILWCEVEFNYIADLPEYADIVTSKIPQSNDAFADVKSLGF